MHDRVTFAAEPRKPYQTTLFGVLCFSTSLCVNVCTQAAFQAYEIHNGLSARIYWQQHAEAGMACIGACWQFAVTQHMLGQLWCNTRPAPASDTEQVLNPVESGF